MQEEWHESSERELDSLESCVMHGRRAMHASEPDYQMSARVSLASSWCAIPKCTDRELEPVFAAATCCLDDAVADASRGMLRRLQRELDASSAERPRASQQTIAMRVT